MFRKILMLTLVLLAFVSIVNAQNATNLTYGSGSVGTLNDDNPLAVYSFNGSTGDAVSLEILPLTEGATQRLSLIAPDQQQLAFTTEELTYRLPVDGVYTALVGGTAGEFAVRLDGTASADVGQPLGNAETQVDLSPVTPAQNYSFEVNDSAVLNLTSATQGFTFRATVKDAEGQTVAEIIGGALQTAALTFSQGSYQVTLSLVQEDTRGAVQVAVSDAPVVVNEAVTGGIEAANPDVGECTATAPDSDISVRGGPGTEYARVDVLPQNETVPVTAISTIGWVVVDTGSTEGWVAESVVILVGECNRLPFEALPTPSTPLETPEGDAPTPEAVDEPAVEATSEE